MAKTQVTWRKVVSLTLANFSVYINVPSKRKSL
jgi:hypothetical protein